MVATDRSSLLLSAAVTICCAAGCNGGVDQHPVTLTVTNGLGAIQYVGWTMRERGVFTCEVRQGGSWEACRFVSPSCMEECDASNAGVGCCLACDAAMPSVKVIDPGQSVSLTWEGKAYPIDENHCSDSCRCYHEAKPEAGHYRAGVCVYDSLSCNSGPCSSPDQDGMIPNAHTAGNKLCSYTEFDVPYEPSTLAITLP